MNNRCEILDDEEIELQEKNKSIFNFRRFDASELEKRSSPFNKTEKKEFPFLFQKKSKRFTEDKKISLDELTCKLESISLDNNKNAVITNEYSIEEEYVSNTPPYPRNFNNDNDEYISNTPPYPPNMNDEDDDLKLSNEEKEDTDGTK